MATVEEKQKFYEALKFTPRTYTINIWGYGGEIVMGTIDRKHFDYFKHRRLDVSDFAWNYDYAEENKIPDSNRPFEPGSWYECDNIAHANGANMDSGTLQICDQEGNTVLECSLEDLDTYNIEYVCDSESYITQQKPDTVVFIGRSNEKGTFFGGELELTAPFDPTKLTIHYDDIDGDSVVTTVYYGDYEIDNNDYSTNGKGSDFGFYLVTENNSWEGYRNSNDIKYQMTEWFSKKINPTRPGDYEIKKTNKDPYQMQAMWTGSRWVNTWTEEKDFNTAEECKIKEWRGIAYDPDADDLIIEKPKSATKKKAEPKAKLNVAANWPF